MADIPERCKSCALWLGHKSGNPDDRRCNRNWGHEPRYGHFFAPEFYDEPYGHPSYVEPNCKVPKWGIPIPELDDEGNAIGLPQKPEMVDAYIPLAQRKLELHTSAGRFITDDESLPELLPFMADPKKLAERFGNRKKKLDKVTQKNISVHKKKMGGIGRVATADYQPPYENGKERIPTGLPQLDHALGGGVTPGTAINLWGPQHSYKSTLSHVFEDATLAYYRNHVYDFVLEQTGDEEIARAAADDEKLLAIVPEGYDASYAQRMGVRPNQVLRPRFDYGEQYLQYAIDIMKQDVEDLADLKEPGVYSYMQDCSVRLIKIDSIDALKWWSDEHGSRDKEQVIHDNQKMGDRAQLLSQYFRLGANMSSVPITAIYITQVRTAMGGHVAWDSGTRGNAFGHNVRLEIKMNVKRSDQRKNTGLTDSIPVELEFRQTQMPGGMNIAPFDSIELIARAGGGIYREDNLLHAAAEAGVIKKSSWLSYVPRGKSDDDKISIQGSYAEYAEVLKEEGVFEEVYDRTMNVLAGRDMDDSGEEETEESSALPSL